MKNEPKYGYYPHWPENGHAWVHPEDVALAKDSIPGPRIWRRDGTHGDFVLLHYGEQRLRVKRTLWVEVSGEGFEVGDWVEVLSRMQKNTPRTGRIREILWDDAAQAIRYQVLVANVPIPNRYAAEDLRHVEPTNPEPPPQ